MKQKIDLTSEQAHEVELNRDAGPYPVLRFGDVEIELREDQLDELLRQAGGETRGQIGFWG